MNKANKYSLLAVLCLTSLPLASHYFTAKQNPSDGIGFDFLLYEPFDFAYILFAFTLIVIVNLKFEKINVSSILKSIIWCVVFFGASFLMLGQLHISLGGQL